MADVIRKATNRFTKGLVMDFSPENTKNEVLTHALNATLLTFNGNELSLQNDMGNARVETAYLPEGYMPVGTCEYGGIIYIVSYNPLEDKSQIGCFPSPERNISNKELGVSDVKIDKWSFQGKDEEGNINGDILNTTQYVLLKNDNLNPGDKFLICSNKEIYNERLADLYIDKDSKYFNNPEDDPNGFELVDNPIIALNVVSIEDNGKIVYLNSDIKQYTINNNYTINGASYEDTYKYHILGEMSEGSNGFEQASIDPDDYRNTLSSGYSVFKSKTSGKLAILAELITIDSYSVTHSVQPKKYLGNEGEVIVENSFDVVIHTEITPEITPTNYSQVPKLQYYYLKNSQGYLQSANDAGIVLKSLFKIGEDDKGKLKASIDPTFTATSLSNIYTPTTDEHLDLSATLGEVGQFNFPKPFTYHGRMVSYEYPEDGQVSNKAYTKFTEGKYHRIKKHQIVNNYEFFKKDIQAKFYRYEKDESGYTEVTTEEISDSYTYYVETVGYNYLDAQRNEEKYKDTDIPLYIITSEPQEADDSILSNELVEKFQNIEVHTYRIATQEELVSETVLFEKDGDKYTEITGSPESGKDYYVLEIVNTYVSIGFGEINRDEYKGTIYYYPTTKDYRTATSEELKIYWNFEDSPFENKFPWGCSIVLYEREEIKTYRVATNEEILNYKELGIKLYYKTDYVALDENGVLNHNDDTHQLFLVVPMDAFASSDKFIPNSQYNYIEGCEKPVSDSYYPEGGYPYDDPISLYVVADFIPNNLENGQTSYEDIKLANIKIPATISVNNLGDLPFKYDYTLVPCMNFGKLDHLAVSNTVDFSKLHAFGQSDFTTWKYYVDENHLRLTFGAEVYDTYETDKVDGLILEFYDLWGFAGSLEITDKKSYSGIFTKVIPLNSLNTLSKNRIEGSRYVNTFKHNINIREELSNGNSTNKYFLNDDVIEFKGFSAGWSISEIDNDCGTIYSNIVYGVRAYLRRSKDSGYEFIHKKDFFLYTIPIYNDFYYTVNNFNNLKDPQLSLMLTYKLKDSSTYIPYNSETITNGYCDEDFEILNKYTNGTYENSKCSLIKYYKYSGISQLYLEIGLKPEYQNFGISYSPLLNNYFSCDLKLVSNEDGGKSFTLQSDAIGENESQMLNYNNKSGTLSVVNKVGFTDFSQNITAGKNKTNSNDFFSVYNFINNPENLYIPIKYEFVVGYSIDINDIVATQTPATTICALCHKSSSGEYNYEDFGIYESGGQFLSNAMFCNGGDVNTEIFSVYRQIKTSGANMIDECAYVDSVETEVQPNNIPGKLNSGNPLKTMVKHVGVLTFCQPHAHGMSQINGVNIHEGDSTTACYGIPPKDFSWPTYGTSGDKEHGFGITPRMYLFNNPKYNLSLNTKNSILYNSEFLSTLDWETVSNREVLGLNVIEFGKVQMDKVEQHWVKAPTMRTYTGFSGAQIELFNKKLLNTMKHVYAYNPDYDSLIVNKGAINITDKKLRFISNIISQNSRLTFDLTESYTNFNDFIYLGSIRFSDYLHHLSNYSIDSKGYTIKTYKNSNENIPLEQLQLVPDLDNCGTEMTPCLISSLTYNMQVPSELESELSFDASNSLVVKHEDGTNQLISGVPNKKTLYGFYNNKLVPLDVSNYYIDSSGFLHIIPENLGTAALDVYSKKITTKRWWTTVNHKYTISDPYKSTQIRGTSLTLNDLEYVPNVDGHRLFVRNGCCSYDPDYRGQLYYRAWNEGTPDTSWIYDAGGYDNKNLNKIFFYTGPCFTSDNLNYNQTIDG